MSDFDLYILKKYLFIPLLVLCIPIQWGPALQCWYHALENRPCGEMESFQLAAHHGRRINKKGKDELSFPFGLAVFCWFEARVRECYAAHLSLPVVNFGGCNYVDL